MITLNAGSEKIGRVNVQVVMPPSFRSCSLPLPFVVLMDSQNQWTNSGSYGGWHTDTIVQNLVISRRLKPIVLIGITSPRNRDRAYAPPPWGGAGILADYLSDELIPSIRRRFHLTTNRDWIGILGASYGANFAVSAALFRPDVFGLCASFSSAPHTGEPLSTMLEKRERLPMRKFYIDCGTKWAYDNPNGFGGDSTAWNRNLMGIASKRLPKGAFRGRVFDEHFHNEEFWRKRVGRALMFLFGR